MFYIDSEKCTDCGACLEVCPQGAISLGGNGAEIDLRRCIECGMCLAVCPVAAIYEVVPQFSRTYKRSDINAEGREVNMMRGRGRFGWGWPRWGGYGRGSGRGFARGWFGGGWGRGNPSPFCRFYPWLPRWWWAPPYAGRYGATTPYGEYDNPYYTPYRAWGWH